jgi:hypothetical protein
MTIENLFVTEFDSMVKHEYGTQESKLEGLGRVRRGNAETYKFNRMGTMIAQEYGSGALQFQNTTFGKVSVTVKDYYAYELAEQRDLNKLITDERRDLAVSSAQAAANRKDQIIIDALDAGKSAASFGADGRSWTLEDFVQMAQFMTAKGIPTTDRYYVCHPTTLGKAFLLEQVGSADYNTIKALSTGELDTYLGFKFIQIGDMENLQGLPFNSSTNVRTNFAFHGGIKGSLGVAMSSQQKSVVEWLPTYDAWKVGINFSCGAVAIGSQEAGREGIYAHLVDEAV